MNVKQTYYFNGHLWVVITDPLDDDAQAVALVNFTSHEPNKDQSCVIQPGEHPAATDLTVIAYKYAFILKLGEREDFLRSANRGADVSGNLLERIQEGTDSDRIPEKVRRFVEAACRRYRIRNRPVSK